MRKLTTILAADVAGYSKHMRADEEGTLCALRKSRAILQDVITSHRGRVFGSAGDSIIAEFGSAVEATEASIAIQCALSDSGAKAAGHPELRFRIGLNLGDVVVEGDDLLGDGVNVAVRIQALAPVGGICLSRSVFEQVRGKLAARFEPLGRYNVKNIAEPIEVYRLALGDKLTPAHRLWLAAIWRRRLVSWITAFLFTVIGVATAWHMHSDVQPSSSRIALAVFPLSAIGDDAMTRRLAGGLTTDIITDLSRFADIEIIALNTAATYKDDPSGPSRMAEELGVSYLLDGSIQREDERIRVSAQLVDLSTGANLWRQRWDRTDADAFAVQAELAEQVAATIGSAEASAALMASEIRKAKNRKPASLQAYDYYLLAVEALGKFNKEAIEFGIDSATSAIALDPSFARAYAIRARLHFNSTHYGSDYEQAMRAMEADARKAVELDPSGAEARVALAWYYSTSGRNQDAEPHIRSALNFNPANITVMKFAAAVFAFSGHADEGAMLADRVLKLDPLATSGTLNTIKDAYFFARRFEDTANIIYRVPSDARSRGARLFLAFSLAFLGREDAALRARTELLEAYPNISAELLVNQGWAFDREEDMKLFLDGFAATKLPVCAADTELAKIEKAKRLAACVAT